MTLTREEILNQPPGRKLDRWIQEHIFNWIPWAEQRRDYTAIVYQKPGEREPYMRTQRWEEAKERYSIIPYSEIDFLLHAVYGDEDWSTSISAAWEVLEKFKQYTVMKAAGWGKEYDCRIWVGITGDQWSVQAKTAPEAICKAALLAALNL